MKTKKKDGLKKCVFNRISFPTLSMEHDSSSGCFYLMFLNDLSVRNTFLTFERRKYCDNLTSEIT